MQYRYINVLKSDENHIPNLFITFQKNYINQIIILLIIPASNFHA